MTVQDDPTYTSFAGSRRLTSGTVQDMLRKTKAALDAGRADELLIFDDQTGTQIDFDFRGSPDEVIGRLRDHPLFRGSDVGDKPRPGRGRPRLGVVCREVSLLPRHWEWLEQQPNGISAAIRRLVDQARKVHPERESVRLSREAASRFITAIAGNLPGFEEASRALFAGREEHFEESTRDWPLDVQAHARHLARHAFRQDI